MFYIIYNSIENHILKKSLLYLSAQNPLHQNCVYWPSSYYLIRIIARARAEKLTTIIVISIATDARHVFRPNARTYATEMMSPLYL